MLTRKILFPPYGRYGYLNGTLAFQASKYFDKCKEGDIKTRVSTRAVWNMNCLWMHHLMQVRANNGTIIFHVMKRSLQRVFKSINDSDARTFLSNKINKDSYFIIFGG